VTALPADAARAAGGRAVVPLVPPALDGDRFRRATRECRLGIAAAAAALADAGLDPRALGGPRTALVYATAAAYGASNRAFVVAASASPEPRAGTLHFPYTAPSAVPAEVAIELGLSGPYVILVGGPAATIDALWQARTWLARRAADRALVLAVETFEECADLWARARRVARPPLVEAAAAVVLEPAPAEHGAPAREGLALGAEARRRAGTTLACEPLVALALARAAGASRARLDGEWRGRRAAITLVTGAQAAHA
jgi:3-oxoacyl-(acyl-carrier-protein) synthase